jgi:hypothetical protein
VDVPGGTASNVFVLTLVPLTLRCFNSLRIGSAAAMLLSDTLLHRSTDRRTCHANRVEESNQKSVEIEAKREMIRVCKLMHERGFIFSIHPRANGSTNGLTGRQTVVHTKLGMKS